MARMETEGRTTEGAGAPAEDPVVKEAIAELAQLVGQLDAIIGRLESGEVDANESVSLLEEANRVAAESSRCLEQAIQGVVYGDPGADAADSGRDGG